jgi:hypothetical protein
MSYCKKSGPEISMESRYRGLPRTVTDIAIDPPQIVTQCCSFVSASLPNPVHDIGPSRDRDIGGGLWPALAGSCRREEDRRTP